MARTAGGRPSDREAPRLTLARLFWIFLLGAVLGSLLETLFMYITRGRLYNRSSLLWGQFSLVWGLGALLFTLVLRPLARRGSWAVFLSGSVLGTVFELVCSWFMQLCFGVIFWDYSHLPLSIGGRINLFFSLYWGVAATAWTMWLLPALCALLDKIPARALNWTAAVLAVFLAADILLTGLALLRLDQRQAGLPPATGLGAYLDRRWDDQALFARFPYMRYLEVYAREHPNFW